MSEIKCRVCGATPEQSESIYSEQDGGSQHRHLYQCVDFLQDSVISLRAELERVKAENEWHKYPDEKPELYEYVIVWKPIWTRPHVAKLADYSEWKSIIGVDFDDITHWKPLPAAPEEGE